MGELTNKAKGEVKETGGKLTGDRSTELEGKADKAKGKVQEAGRKLNEGFHEGKGRAESKPDETV